MNNSMVNSLLTKNPEVSSSKNALIRMFLRNRFSFKGGKKIYILIIIAGICILNFPFLNFNTIMCSDEYSAIGIPAYLAGYNWSSEIPGFVWHGTGFTILLTPFFRVIHNFTTVYHIGLIFCLILLCIDGICIFCILNNKIGVRNLFLTAGISIISVSGALEAGNGYGLSLMNEVPLSTIAILTACLLLYDGRNKKHNFLNVALLGILLGYAGIIHSRCLIIFAAVFVYEALECFCEKDRKRWIHLICLIAIFGIAYTILTDMNGQLLSNMGFTLGSESDMTPDAMVSSLGRAIGNIGQQFIRLWWIVKLFLSLTATLNLISGGLFAVATAGLIIAFFGGNLDKKYKHLILFLVMLVHGMNFCIALKCNGCYQTNNYRWLTYIRYARAFAPLYIAIGLGFLSTLNDRAIKTVIRLSSLFCVITFVTYKSLVIPVLLESKYFNNYSIFGMMFSIKVNKNDMLKIYSLFMLAMICLLVLYRFGLKWKKLSLIYIMFLLFSIVVNWGQYDFLKKRDNNYVLMIDSTLETINLLDEEEILQKTNVYYNGGDKYNKYLRLAAFWVDMLNEPPNMENYIFFTDDILIENDDYIISLDEDEYLITDRDHIVELLLETNQFPLIQEKNNNYEECSIN